MKKLVTIMVMMITMIIGAVSVNAVCLTEDSRPDIVGMVSKKVESYTDSSFLYFAKNTASIMEEL